MHNIIRLPPPAKRARKNKLFELGDVVLIGYPDNEQTKRHHDNKFWTVVGAARIVDVKAIGDAVEKHDADRWRSSKRFAQLLQGKWACWSINETLKFRDDVKIQSDMVVGGNINLFCKLKPDAGVIRKIEPMPDDLTTITIAENLGTRMYAVLIVPKTVVTHIFDQHCKAKHLKDPLITPFSYIGIPKTSFTTECATRFVHKNVNPEKYPRSVGA